MSKHSVLNAILRGYLYSVKNKQSIDDPINKIILFIFEISVVNIVVLFSARWPTITVCASTN